uniref:Uncharacterized protein n=1 Tax=Anguilla anguilla TaxID=7936 RepID=A0A0E9X9J3_ANGAN
MIEITRATYAIYVMAVKSVFAIH